MPNQPKMRNGATTMLMMTVTVCTTMPGRKLPTPRSAEAMATMPNWSPIAGRK
jgi:hypothetical protein